MSSAFDHYMNIGFEIDGKHVADRLWPVVPRVVDTVQLHEVGREMRVTGVTFGSLTESQFELPTVKLSEVSQ